MLGYRQTSYWRFTIDTPVDVSLEAWAGSGERSATVYFSTPLGTPSSKLWNPVITLRDAQDVEVARIQHSSGRRGDVNRRVLEPGTYYVRVQDPGAGTGYSTSYDYRYTIELLRTPR
ncbi:MAG: hypothetical protein R3F43_27570 [bacterium]